MLEKYTSLLSSTVYVSFVGLIVATTTLVLATPPEEISGKNEPTETVAAEGAIPSLPEGIASFGAALAGGEIFVYGGHVGRTHHHSVDNLSHRFLRLRSESLAEGWKVEPAKGLQGLALVAHENEVCRVGGLDAHNAADAEEEDLHSVDDVRCFDAKTGEWRDLPPLPAPRSSHDAVVHDGTLWVVGGWQLRGAGQESIWHEDVLSLDLRHPDAEWVSIPQPFSRRALAAAAHGGRLYAIGGIGEDGTSRRVDIYDTEAATWSEGPELPELGRLKGFGLAALGLETGPSSGLYISPADGQLRRLEVDSEGTATWSEGLVTLETPRFFHRLLADESYLYFVGGASREGHLADTERVERDGLSLVAEATDSEPTDSEPADSEPADAEKADLTASELPAWPGFRGDGTGASPTLPEHWSESQGLAWSTELPGYGQSSPVIWGDLAIVSSIDGPLHGQLILTGFDMQSGEVRWRRLFDASQQVEEGTRPEMVSRAAPTPVVDEDRIYTFWESGDVVAVDHRGETLWHRSLVGDYGSFHGNHGVASSPVLASGSLIVQVTHDGPSYYVAIDKTNGQTIWKTDRPDGVAWTTPSLIMEGETEVLISSAAGRVEALDAGTGELLWEFSGIEKNHVPSAVIDGDSVIVASSAPGQSFALRRPRPTRTKADGAEAIPAADTDSGAAPAPADEDILWRAEGVSSGFGSPVVSGPCVLFTNKNGTATCVDRTDGHVRWKHRLGEAVWASPLVSGDAVYFFGQKGETVVLRPGPEGPKGEIRNALPTDEETVYGVAATTQTLLIRTGSKLVCVRNEAAPEAPAGSQQAP